MARDAGAVRALAVTPDASVLLSAADDTTIRIWRVQTGEVARRPSLALALALA